MINDDAMKKIEDIANNRTERRSLTACIQWNWYSRHTSKGASGYFIPPLTEMD